MRIESYQIEMTNRMIDTADHYADILVAVGHAGLDIYSKCGMQIQHPLLNDGKMYMDIKIPDCLPSDFESEKQLWRISEYMVRLWGAKYRGMMVDDSLLSFQRV